jgi:hypothetical protein
MYPQPQPDLHTLPFPTLAALAEAVEKYMVYAALTVCRMRMECVAFFCGYILFEEALLTVMWCGVCVNYSRDAIPAHPLKVLLYALRHDHIALANESAQQSMGLSPAHALEILPPETFRTWVRLLFTSSIFYPPYPSSIPTSTPYIHSIHQSNHPFLISFPYLIPLSHYPLPTTYYQLPTTDYH